MRLSPFIPRNAVWCNERRAKKGIINVKWVVIVAMVIFNKGSVSNI